MKKLIQLFDCDGYPAGLYATDRTDTENFQGVFDLAIAAAKHTAENDTEEEIDVREQAEELLLEDGFERIFAESVSTNEF